MRDLLQTIKDNAAVIDSAMERYLSHEKVPYEVLYEAMRYSAGAGGKRIRPFLAIEFCRMLGGKDADVLPFAAAIEMIHTYSLIHDDLPCMDNDDYRRGKLTNHKVFGEATALLAGDALLTAAFGTAISEPSVSAVQKLTAVSLLSENAGVNGMVGGQMLDLLGEKEMPDEENFLLMNRLKTGCLIRTACLLGCIAAGVMPGTAAYAAAEKYADAVGLAFQIEDDLLDAGTEDNKTTFLSFLSAEAAGKKVEELTREAADAISGYPGSELLIAFAGYLAVRKK